MGTQGTLSRFPISSGKRVRTAKCKRVQKSSQWGLADVSFLFPVCRQLCCGLILRYYCRVMVILSCIQERSPNSRFIGESGQKYPLQTGTKSSRWGLADVSFRFPGCCQFCCRLILQGCGYIELHSGTLSRSPPHRGSGSE